MTGYCEHCKKQVTLIVKTRQTDAKVRFRDAKGLDRNIKYDENTAFCAECGTEAFVDKLTDKNIVNYNQACREHL